MRRRGRGRTAGGRDDDDLDREIAAEMAAVRQLSEGVIEQQRELMNDQAEVINRDFARAEDLLNVNDQLIDRVEHLEGALEATGDERNALRHRVEELETENHELRERVATLEAKAKEDQGKK